MLEDLESSSYSWAPYGHVPEQIKYRYGTSILMMSVNVQSLLHISSKDVVLGIVGHSPLGMMHKSQNIDCTSHLHRLLDNPVHVTRSKSIAEAEVHDYSVWSIGAIRFQSR